MSQLSESEAAKSGRSVGPSSASESEAGQRKQLRKRSVSLKKDSNIDKLPLFRG